jgi:hypothetical protein
MIPPILKGSSFNGAVALFGEGCLKYYPKPSEFETWVARNKFEMIPAEYVGSPIKEFGGKAYSVNNHGVRYLLIAEPSNLCTVFVKEVNLPKANEALANVRKGFGDAGMTESTSATEKNFANGLVKTTEFTYTENGKWIMTLVVSESTSSQGFFQLAMSAQSKLRADNLVNEDAPR